MIIVNIIRNTSNWNWTTHDGLISCHTAIHKPTEHSILAVVVVVATVVGFILKTKMKKRHQFGISTFHTPRHTHSVRMYYGQAVGIFNTYSLCTYYVLLVGLGIHNHTIAAVSTYWIWFLLSFFLLLSVVYYITSMRIELFRRRCCPMYWPHRIGQRNE